MSYVLRRVVHGLLLLLGISIGSFALAALAPGDFYSDLALDARISAETVSGLRAAHQLDRPIAERYTAWMASVVRGEFGYSLAYRTAAGPLIRQRIGATLRLTLTANFLAWALAIPLGLYHAMRRGRWQDHALSAAAALLLSIPELLLAIALLVLAVETRWFSLTNMAIPLAVLVLGMFPVLERHVRAAVVETMSAPFTLAASAHGIPRGRILYRQVLPAALHPLITLFGFSLGTLLSASLLVEVLVGWPGLGPLFLEAILARDFAIVLGVVMVSAALLIGGNLVADLMLYRADPRIRIR